MFSLLFCGDGKRGTEEFVLLSLGTSVGQSWDSAPAARPAGAPSYHGSVAAEGRSVGQEELRIRNSSSGFAISEPLSSGRLTG